MTELTEAQEDQVFGPAAELDALRREIDRIDGALHGLLMERGAIIDRLIAAKARGGGGSAFRPAREAAMMRRLVERHRGILPLDTVEGIWRLIISTFTYVQAPYAVHAAGHAPGGDAPLRDSCRFHFGFTPPLETHGSAAAVIDAVAAARGDLGVIPVPTEPGGDPWWEPLRASEAPKVIARLPFVERADHAAGLPLFVVAKPITDAPPQEVSLHAVDAPAGVRPRLDGSVEVVARAGASLLVAAAMPAAQAAAALNVPASAVTSVGSHARRYKPAHESRLTMRDA